jgi:subtilisin family serine protease
MPGRRTLAIALLAGVGLALPYQGARAQAGPAPSALRQIEALLAEKAGRLPAERKLASRLLHAARRQRGLRAAPGVPELRTGVEADARGETLVDLRAEATPRLLARIRALGGRVVGSWPELRALRVRVPLASCELLAELPEVRGMRPADQAVTHASDVTQGVVAHRADRARAIYGVDGSGIRVGVLSDGVDALAALQASGDLPGVTVLPGQAGFGSEGTAMLEIVHDVAPGAELFFATAFNGQASFASNIVALRAAGADVIVDDVRYFAEAIFQDGPVAQAVDAVAAEGALYFSAAGNEGSLDAGSAGVWEGDFAESGFLLQGSPLHDFGAGALADRVTRDAPYVFLLQWSDPQDGSANDYDLFLLDSTQTSVVASSTDFQNGDDDPLELIDSRVFDDTDTHLAVVLYAGSPRHLHLNAFRGELELASAGQTAGHAAAAGALGVAAVDVRLAAGPGGSFAGSEPVERFSSDGPRRIFYTASGYPYSPGDLLGSGGIARQAPRLAAADCVDTATPGFNTFCGTSAAAPHAAAIAALLLELARERGHDTPEVRAALLATALDLDPLGVDRNSGAGLADAFAAATALWALPADLPGLASPALALLAALFAALGALRSRR